MNTWLPEVLRTLGNELAADFPDAGQVTRMSARLLAALLLGGILGWERERVGKAAGMRTHMLVAMGTAVVVLAAQFSGMPDEGVSRVIQGALAGIGFIGGGAILKLSDQGQIKGLTTAANIWLTAAIGIAVGAGRLGLAIVATILAFMVLHVLAKLEPYLTGHRNRDDA